MATKTINTRIGLKYDSYSAWEAVKDTFVPIKGEVIFYEIPAAAEAVVNEPAILFKVGVWNGTDDANTPNTTYKPLSQLPWGSAIAADVYAWAKQQTLLGGTRDQQNPDNWTFGENPGEPVDTTRSELTAFIHEQTSNIAVKVDKVTEQNFQSIYGVAYDPSNPDHVAKIGKYQTSVSTTGPNGQYTATGDPFEMTVTDYTASNGVKKVGNDFQADIASGSHLTAGANGLDVTESTVTYTPAAAGSPAVLYTQEEYDAYVAEHREAPEWNVGDIKTPAVNPTDATLTATDGVLTDDAIVPIKSYVDAKLADAGTAGAVTVEKLSTATSGYASTYVVKQGGVQVGAAIDIPKDFLVKSATLSTVETAGEPYAGAVVGDKYIDFIVNTTDSSETATHIYLPVKDLVDVYTGGSTNYAVTTVDNGNIITTEIKTASVATAHGVQYSFTSYSAETGGTQYGTGTVEVIGTDTTNNKTTVKVLTNTVDGWAGRTFTVNAVEPFESNTRYQLIENDTELPVWVQITGKTDSTDGIAVASDVKQYVDSQIAVATPNIAAGDGIAVATVENNVAVAVLLDETNSTITNNAGSGLVVSQDGLRIDDGLEWHLQCGGAPSQS